MNPCVSVLFLPPKLRRVPKSTAAALLPLALAVAVVRSVVVLVSSSVSVMCEVEWQWPNTVGSELGTLYRLTTGCGG